MSMCTSNLPQVFPQFSRWTISCSRYGSGTIVVCRGKRQAKNTLYFHTGTDIGIFEPDQIPPSRSIPSNGPACDFAILEDRAVSPRLFLVELKGRHIKHGIEQLESTLSALLKEWEAIRPQSAYVAFKGVCGIPQAQVPNYKAKFKRQNFGCELLFKRPNTPTTPFAFPS